MVWVIHCQERVITIASKGVTTYHTCILCVTQLVSLPDHNFLCESWSGHETITQFKCKFVPTLSLGGKVIKFLFY